MALLRYQFFLALGALLLALWRSALARLPALQSSPLLRAAVALLGLDAVSSSPTAAIEVGVRYLPLWAIVALGVYALSAVLWRVATFGDCPEAAEELAGEIAGAKAKLKAAGFAFS